jgi:3-oxoacyl-[acyl-carrier protein] reductase
LGPRRGGAQVAVGYLRDHAGADGVVAEIEASGGGATADQGDLAQTAEVEAMILRTVAALGPASILVNHAAMLEYRSLAEIDEVHFDTIKNTNVLPRVEMRDCERREQSAQITTVTS